MTFHQDIAAIQAAMTGCSATGGADKTLAPAAPGLREGRRMFDSLYAQFDAHSGPSVACLSMGDSPPRRASRADSVIQ